MQILNLYSRTQQFLYNFKAKIESFPIKLQNLPPKLKEFSPKLKHFFLNSRIHQMFVMSKNRVFLANFQGNSGFSCSSICSLHIPLSSVFNNFHFFINTLLGFVCRGRRCEIVERYNYADSANPFLGLPGIFMVLPMASPMLSILA